MVSLPDLDDLRLVAAVARTGSIGAAARELRISQPSASQRLARLERRTGLPLFVRDPVGARPTPAGDELARQAAHVLDHLSGMYDAVRAATAARPLRVGVFHSMAQALLPVLDEELADAPFEPHVDHGDRLLGWVSEGTMDAAFVGIAKELPLPRTTAHAVGGDRLVLFLPVSAPTPAGRRQPLREQDVVFCTYDLGSDELRARLAALGGRPRRGGDIASTLTIARRRGHPAVVPRSALANLADGERQADLPFTHRLQLSMVTGPDPDPRLLEVLPRLRQELALD